MRGVTAEIDLAVAVVETSAPRGAALLMWLQQQPPPLDNVPVLAVAPQALRQHDGELQRAGADAVVRSPIESVAALGDSVLRILQRPAGPAPARDDRLSELLAMAGPTGRTELLDQLETDLSRVAEALASAVEREAWQALRAESHVLVSLSGTLGRQALLEVARHLNEAAHNHDARAAADLLTAVLPELYALIAQVAAEPREPAGHG